MTNPIFMINIIPYITFDATDRIYYITQGDRKGKIIFFAFWLSVLCHGLFKN